MQPPASHRAQRRGRAGAALLACGLVAACGALDAVDAVHDLRLLGMRADPPDQGLDVAASGLGLATPPQPVQVTALVADPAGLGRPIAYSFAVCPALDEGGDANTPGGVSVAGGGLAGASGSHRCPPDTRTVFAAGTAVATDGWVEVTGTFTADEALLFSAFNDDPYHGIDGLWLPVELTLAAGDESVVGTKRVTFAPAPAGLAAYPANQNPVVTGLTLAGAPWPEGTPAVLRASARPAARGWQVVPQFDPALAVAYSVATFRGPPLVLQEQWRFDYFAAVGGFAPTTAGGQGLVADHAASPASWWLPARPAAGPIPVWVVCRDGRGGESWLTRTASLQP